MRTAEQMASSWSENVASPAAQTKYKQSIENLTVSPTELAASPQAEENYLRGIQESVRTGRRRERLMAVSLADYKKSAIAKVGRLREGAEVAKPKVMAALQKFRPVYMQIKDAVRAMPKGGEANAVARMLAARRLLKQAAGKSAD